MKRQINMLTRGRNVLSGLISAMAVAVLLVAPGAGLAQETTSSVRGTITQPDGTPAGGATVRVTDTRTGTSRTTTTSDSGQFSASGLRVGGPYTIQVEAAGSAPQSITDVTLGLGETFTFYYGTESRRHELILPTRFPVRILLNRRLIAAASATERRVCRHCKPAYRSTLFRCVTLPIPAYQSKRTGLT